MHTNDTAEIIAQLAPILISFFAMIGSCYGIWHNHTTNKEVKDKIKETDAKVTENKATIAKVETALYSSPAINGPYARRRAADKRETPVLSGVKEEQIVTDNTAG